MKTAARLQKALKHVLASACYWADSLEEAVSVEELCYEEVLLFLARVVFHPI